MLIIRNIRKLHVLPEIANSGAKLRIIAYIANNMAKNFCICSGKYCFLENYDL